MRVLFLGSELCLSGNEMGSKGALAGLGFGKSRRLLGWAGLLGAEKESSCWAGLGFWVSEGVVACWAGLLGVPRNCSTV